MTSITHCRGCGSPELGTIMSLGDYALTGMFPKPGIRIPEAPLRLMRCLGECGLVQLADTYDLAAMYGMDYGYRSGLNAGMVAHLKTLAEQAVSFRPLKDGELVVDIGANDGTTLAGFPKTARRLGVDPTGVKFRQFYEPGIELIPDFFSGAKVKETIGKQRAAIVTSFSMFYDLEDPSAFMREVFDILADDGVWMMEQSYLQAMMRNNAFDTNCHEHLEYYGLRQIDWMAKRAGLQVLSVWETPTNGGSFVVLLAKQGAPHWLQSSDVTRMLDAESANGLRCPGPYEAFRLRAEAASRCLEEFLRNAKKDRKLVYGLGASTKGNVLLQSIPGIADLIFAIGDVNPDKWGCTTPGTGIPIVPEEAALADNPDFLVVLPWHFRNGFLKNPKFAGRKLVFPLPQLEIVQL